MIQDKHKLFQQFITTAPVIYDETFVRIFLHDSI